MILEGENILADDYPVYPDFAYVCDGEVCASPIQGTVRDLKRVLEVCEVRNCKIVDRFYKQDAQSGCASAPFTDV